jgi:recombination protein RecA
MATVLANIEKSMGNKSGKPTFSRFKDIEVDNTPVISFGIPAVDDASYCGGIPRGKMIEIFGPESSGKSLLTLYLIASAQKAGNDCALLDVEQSFDPIWAKKHGVDVNNLVFSNEFESGENAIEYAYQLCRSGAFALVVVDSTAALTPRSELEGSLEDNAVVGEQARLMSRGCRKIISACSEGNTTCCFINQVRDKIGVMYGNPETTPGGKALRFYSHQRIRVSTKEKIKASDKVVGQISRVTFVKNKTARPFGQCEFKIIFDAQALNPVVMLCTEARALKLIKPHSGILRILGLEAKPIITGVTSLVEVADYIVKNNLVIDLLNKVIETNQEEDEPKTIDEAILEMLTDASKIVSPIDTQSSSLGDIKKVADASGEEIGEDAKEDAEPDEA